MCESKVHSTNEVFFVRLKTYFDAGVDKTNEPTQMRTEGYHFLWCLHSRGGVYQSFHGIMELDSRETWPLVETLLRGYQGSSG